ncbi:Sulfite reduction-associated complex DsrMKJOP multiheme protein DsrJ (=HmeF) [uncultured Candidatus Thioglobus sp.]|nr:Sulfite reduction-associated complex DsrMKJOP multiheme protein DsrJ (=HmeF) [uncultured Candidatus Thioglobus sp.]SMN02193.1 Sulfite reduction-associated complex DsrMKJOP multiheme protein DsrJ (=HmeF) [uncultured Candidatus Thioglobus sp.]
MKRLLIIFLISMSASAFAHADKHINLGDRATELKEEGKSRDIHPSLSEIIKMHPEFLLHKRDKTLRQGVRTKRDSLKECVNCHSVSKNNEFVPINAPDQFCSTCHQKVGTSLDCFACHRTTPAEEI